MREGAKSKLLKYTLFGLLLMAMGGLAIMDVGGTVSRGIGANLVKYQGGKISVIEFRRSLREVLQKQRIDEVTAYKMGIPQQFLQSEINRILISKASRDIGLQMDDKQAALQVKEIITPLVEQGATEKEALNHVLMNSSMGERQFLEMIKNHMSTQKLMSIILGNSFSNPQVEEDLMRYDNETRNGKYFSISFADIAKVDAPSNEVLKDYYSKVTNEYVTPEFRDLSMMSLDKNSLAKGGEVSDERLKQAYDENLDNFTAPETREISQIATKDENTAKEIFAAIQENKKLEEVAKKFEAQYIKTNKFTKNTIAPEFVEDVFAAEKGKALEPIKTPMGWHVVLVENIIDGQVMPFEKVKDELRKELQQEVVAEALYKLADKIDDAVASGASLQDIAKENALKVTSVNNIKADGSDKDGKKVSGVSEKVLRSAFELEEGATSNLIEEGDGLFVLVKADKVTPARNLGFDEIKSDLSQRWVTKEKVKLLSEKSLEVIKKIKTSADFAKIAKEMNKTIADTGYIKRYPLKGEKDNVNLNIRSTLFSIRGKGETTTANGGNESVYILNLTDSKIPAYKNIEQKDKAEAKKSLSKEAQEDLLEQYMAGLMAKYKVKINHGVMERMYKDALSQAEAEQQQ